MISYRNRNCNIGPSLLWKHGCKSWSLCKAFCFSTDLQLWALWCA